MVDLLDGITLTTSVATSGATCSSWSPTIANPANANDVDDSTYSGRGSTVKNGPCTYYTIWEADLGAEETAGAYRIKTNHVGHWSLEHADAPGGPWTSVADFDGIDGEPFESQFLHTGTFGPVDARYWRLAHSQFQAGLLFLQAINLFTWELLEDGSEPEPEPEPPNPDDYVPPEPARAIVEIFVDDPDGAKWDAALWGTDVWPAAFWFPIDYLSLSVNATTGTNQGDRGILAQPVAGTFVVDTHDPDRELDPANVDSPFAGQIVPGLPVRVNHRSTTLRTAWLDRAEYSVALRGGRLVASDSIGRLARALVPGDLDLADTLYARALAAIEAAGVPVTVLPAPDPDPPLASYTPPGADDDVPAWDIIASAALETLHVPYIDRHGALGFRSWTEGLERGRTLEAPALIDVTSWVSDDGLYSVVRVLDPDGTTVHERSATPTPRYGMRVWDRDERTIDPETWAERVLADRRAQTVRYRPGEVRPETADDVEYYGTLEVLEGVDVIVPLSDISDHVRIMGSRLTVVDETKDPDVVRSRWRFTYTTSASPPTPLVNDDDPDDFLTNEAEDDFLYAD